MGMYTELYMSFRTKNDTPKQVINVLKYMFDDRTFDPRDDVPDHEFFKLDRWSSIGNSSSYYFTPMATSKMMETSIGEGYSITTRSDLKNYQSEIGFFIDWIMPYIDACDGDHLGHYRYEEDQEPTLIYYKEN